MYKRLGVTVVMPGRNVLHIVNEQMKLIPDFVDEVILVSNNSKDNIESKILELQSKHSKLKIVVDNRVDSGGIGYGFAIQTGFNIAKGDLVFKIDVDGTYPIEKLDEVIDYLLIKKLDFISCNRYPVKKETTIPLKLKIGTNLLNFAFRIRRLYFIKDVIGGFYGGFTNKVKELNFTQGGWNFSIEFKSKAIAKERRKYGEFHIVQKQNLTESHQEYFKTGIKHLVFIIFGI